MSDWLFDLGNTRFKFAAFDGVGAGEVQAVAHGADDGAVAWQSTLPRGEAAWVSSVASPALTQQVLQTLQARFAQVHVVRSQAQCGPLRIAYANPGKFGVDRFLALLAVAGDGVPTLVIGVGTALTVDLVDAQGQHCGGRIAPSPTVMREALHARAVQLPVTGGQYAEFALDTEDALASGCDGAAVALIERSVAQAAQVLGAPPRLVVHGGGVHPLLPLLPPFELRPSLVLDGLARWALHAGAGNG